MDWRSVRGAVLTKLYSHFHKVNHQSSELVDPCHTSSDELAEH